MERSSEIVILLKSFDTLVESSTKVVVFAFKVDEPTGLLPSSKAFAVLCSASCSSRWHHNSMDTADPVAWVSISQLRYPGSNAKKHTVVYITESFP